jgi:hypothetical protein
MRLPNGLHQDLSSVVISHLLPKLEQIHLLLTRHVRLQADLEDSEEKAYNQIKTVAKDLAVHLKVEMVTNDNWI